MWRGVSLLMGDEAPDSQSLNKAQIAASPVGAATAFPAIDHQMA
jgi:hypothetical protein